ncbi:hypothetical protein Q7P37_007654 [Cladosporium fusiforme]
MSTTTSFARSNNQAATRREKTAARSATPFPGNFDSDDDRTSDDFFDCGEFLWNESDDESNDKTHEIRMMHAASIRRLVKEYVHSIPVLGWRGASPRSSYLTTARSTAPQTPRNTDEVTSTPSLAELADDPSLYVIADDDDDDWVDLGKSTDVSAKFYTKIYTKTADELYKSEVNAADAYDIPQFALEFAAAIPTDGPITPAECQAWLL